MKLVQLSFFLLATINVVYGQELNYKLSNTYINPFGENTDLVGFTPLFKLESDSIHNRQSSVKINYFPKGINRAKTAYCFMYFNGIKDGVFSNEIALLIEDYTATNPKIYVDKNGNIDFTDDGEPQFLNDNLILKLANSVDSSAVYHYRISKSQIDKSNESQMKARYINKFPRSNIISPVNWLTNQRLSVRISKEVIDNKLITILIYDGTVDGQFTFQTNEIGDRILITEDEINIVNDLNSYLRQGEPIDHNATFLLYGKKYNLNNIEKNGNSLSITETNKNTKLFFKQDQDVSSFEIQLLSGHTQKIQDLINLGKHLLIDVGGTWCGGCISQEPTIKQLYNNGKIEVVGIFGHDTKESVVKYTAKHNISWPVALMSLSFKDMFRIDSYPTYILVSPEGKIVLIDRNSEQVVKYLNN